MSEQRHFVALLAEAERRCIPLDVSLELTHRCNFRCEHCYIPDHQRGDGVSTPRLLTLLEELAGMGTLFLTLTGGEVFLRRDWYTVAGRARELGFALRLYSNASLIDDEVADAVAGLAAAVEVSLYSLDEEVFEAITRRRGSLQRTLGGIERLRQRQVEIKLKVPVMARNLSGLEKVFRYAEGIGATCTSDSRMLPGKDGDLGPTRLQVPHEELLQYYRSPYSGCQHPSESLAEQRGDGVLCAAGVRFVNITAAGEVRACNVLPVSAGNINERPFREIWEGSPWLARLRGIRRRDLPVCRSCARLAYCKRCAAQALVEDGDLLGPARWSCEHAEALEEAFEDDG